jgi:hypothetical protein
MATSAPEVISSTSEVAPSTPSTKTSTGSKESAGIQERLSHTREQLANTVGNVEAQMDVSSGVKNEWQATNDTVHDKIGQVTRHLHNRKPQTNAHLP